MEMKSGMPYSLNHQQKHAKNQKSSLSSEYLRRKERSERRTGRLVSGYWSVRPFVAWRLRPFVTWSRRGGRAGPPAAGEVEEWTTSLR
nr:hypothetical protein Iba_chr15aCG7260 [Ipomoea batatas]